MLSIAVIFWYFSSAVCTSCGKAALNLLLPRAGSCALSLTTMQFVISAVATVFACGILGRRPPSAPFETFLVSLSYTMGFLLLNCSLGKLAASFSETVRGLEPLTSFILVRIFAARGGALTSGMAGALLCVLLGAALAVWAQPAFDLNGLLLGLLANCAFSSRGLLVTMLQDAAQRKAKWEGATQAGAPAGAPTSSAPSGAIDPIGLFAAQHVLGLVVLAPAAYIAEGATCARALRRDEHALQMAAYSALGFLTYNFLSLLVLLLMDAVSHSVLNTTRRAVTIVAAAIFFQNAISFVSAVGIVLIIGGACAYAVFSSRAKRAAATAAGSSVCGLREAVLSHDSDNSQSSSEADALLKAATGRGVPSAAAGGSDVESGGRGP